MLWDLPRLDLAIQSEEHRTRLDAFGDWPADAEQSATIVTRFAPGHDGWAVPLTVVTPPQVASSRPALVWAHGGAFRFGSADAPDMRRLSVDVANRANAVVVQIDYRLAVDGVHFPTPHHDVTDGIRYVRDNADALGIDPGRITIGGDSAGANLITGAALRLRDHEAWAPRHLVLLYPDMHADLPSAGPDLRATLGELPTVLRTPPAMVEEMAQNYLGDAAADGYAIPALADLRGLAPTTVITAEYDDLRTSGDAFGAALDRADVPVEVLVAAGMLHGFIGLPAEFETAQSVRDAIADLTRQDRLVASPQHLSPAPH